MLPVITIAARQVRSGMSSMPWRLTCLPWPPPESRSEKILLHHNSLALQENQATKAGAVLHAVGPAGPCQLGPPQQRCPWLPQP